MLVLTCNAGPYRFAIPAKQIVRVLPRMSLRLLAEAPKGVAGLLLFRGRWLPVVDLCTLLCDRAAAALSSTRLVVVNVETAAETRSLALLAEGVLGFEEFDASQQVFESFKASFLGGLALTQNGPQLLHPQEIMPDVLKAMGLKLNFEAGLSNHGSELAPATSGGL